MIFAGANYPGRVVIVRHDDGLYSWYRIALPAGDDAWLQVAYPHAGDRGSDGRPSGVRLIMLPAVTTG